MDKDYKKCLKYIDKYWRKSTFKVKKDDKLRFSLPNKFVSPNATYFKQDFFYWDSYFIILGLLESGRVKLAEGMVDNFTYTYNRFGKIPNRNRFYNLDSSQSPFLSSMVMEVFAINKNREWLKKNIKTVESEFNSYWNKDCSERQKRFLPKGLACQCNHYGSHKVAEYETGWDLTSRFNNRCLDFAPVDFNCLLYKYEKDLFEVYDKILKNKKKAKKYKRSMNERKKLINSLMWDEKKKFYFDYNAKTKKAGNFWSIAGFYPLWVGIASKKQALGALKNLKRFEEKGGLADTQSTKLLKPFEQWDYPNGWPNLQWIVIRGLLNYDFKEDAQRIALKWLEMNRKIFIKTNKFWEKYNVVTVDIGKAGRYPTQSGFGWTNAIFLKLYNEFIKK